MAERDLRRSGEKTSKLRTSPAAARAMRSAGAPLADHQAAIGNLELLRRLDRPVGQTMLRVS